MKPTPVVITLLVLSKHLTEAVVDTEYYSLLGVDPSATDRDIRKAFKKLALKHHPDKNPGSGEATSKFIELNAAYEVLKNSDTRREYDRMGHRAYESNKKGGRGPSDNGWGFHNYQWYSREFGLYDNDPQIETLNDQAFHAHDVSDAHVIVNFYSPGCSHCHDLAPIWRDLGSELQGVLPVAAVNCHDSRSLCQQLGIRAYPTLIRLGVSADRTTYRGARDLASLRQFALEPFEPPRTVESIEDLFLFSGPKLILICGTSGSPLTAHDLPLKLLVAALHGQVPILQVDCVEHPLICTDKPWQENHARLVLENTATVGIRIYPLEHEEWDAVFSVHSLVNATTTHLPLPQLLDSSELDKAIQFDQYDALQPHVTGDIEKKVWVPISAERACETNDNGIVRFGSMERSDNVTVCMEACERRPDCRAVDFFRHTRWCNFFKAHCDTPRTVWHGASSYRLQRGTGVSATLVLFTAEPTVCTLCPQAEKLMRQISGITNRLNVNLFIVRCSDQENDSSQCLRFVATSSTASLSLYKRSGREDFVGSLSYQEVSSWIHSSVDSVLVSLGPDELHNAINSLSESFFIGYVRSACPSCHAMLLKLRGAAKKVDIGQTRFAIFDCDQYPDACVEATIDSWPIAVYYSENSSTPHFFDVNYFQVEIDAFFEHISDAKTPPLTPITPDEWEHGVIGSSNLHIVAFVGGRWCRPCNTAKQELSKVVKNLIDLKVLSVSTLDCDTYSAYCGGHHVHKYPEIRLWKAGSKSMSDGGLRYSGGRITSRDIQSWIGSHLPQKVQTLTESTFAADIMSPGAWTSFVVFSCPRWCRPCQKYQTDLQLIANILDSRRIFVNVGFVDCDDYRAVCQTHGVRVYPTIRLRTSSGRLLSLRPGTQTPLQTVDWIIGNLDWPENLQTARRQLQSFFSSIEHNKSQNEIDEIIFQYVKSTPSTKVDMIQRLSAEYSPSLISILNAVTTQLTSHDEL